MTYRGAGLAPAGSSRAGFGSPASANGSGTVPLPSTKTGLPEGARLIDARTRRYVLVNGRVQGMPPVPQKVQIAAMTALNSSAVRGLGIDFSGAPVITDGVINQLQTIFRNAFASLVSRGLMRIESIDVTPVRDSGALVHVRWTDLTTSTSHELTI